MGLRLLNANLIDQFLFNLTLQPDIKFVTDCVQERVGVDEFDRDVRVSLERWITAGNQ